MIVHFTECKSNSTVASARITNYLKEMFGESLYDRKGVHEIKSYDRLIIVNGPFAFCDFLEEIGQLVTLAKEVIWVQNDYAIMPPAAVSKAESPFRKAFGDRNLRPHFWTTVKKNVKTSEDRYVNWNALVYTTPLERPPATNMGVYYHGAFRQNRVESFNRFFPHMKQLMYIDTTGTARWKKFAEQYPLAVRVESNNLIESINQHQWALYIEDEKSHNEFHSPANRFYEYVSAGVPIAFDIKSERMLLEAGLPIKKEWLFRDGKDLMDRLSDSDKVYEEQRTLVRPYRKELDEVVRRLK